MHRSAGCPRKEKRNRESDRQTAGRPALTKKSNRAQKLNLQLNKWSSGIGGGRSVKINTTGGGGGKHNRNNNTNEPAITQSRNTSREQQALSSQLAPQELVTRSSFDLNSKINIITFIILYHTYGSIGNQCNRAEKIAKYFRDILKRAKGILIKKKIKRNLDVKAYKNHKYCKNYI